MVYCTVDFYYLVCITCTNYTNMTVSAIQLGCRCCDEGDVEEIFSLIDESTVNGWSHEKLHNDLSSSQCQWYCIESDEEDVLFGAFRLVLDQENQRQVVATVTDFFIATDAKTSEDIHNLLINYAVNHLMRISYQLNAMIIHIEVFEDENELIEHLEKENFQETGGYLSEVRSMMKFKYSRPLLKAGSQSSLPSIEIIPEPSSTAEGIDECDDLGETLDMVLDLTKNSDGADEGFTIDSPFNTTDETSRNDNMLQLINTLFTALHKESDSFAKVNA